MDNMEPDRTLAELSDAWKGPSRLPSVIMFPILHMITQMSALFVSVATQLITAGSVMRIREINRVYYWRRSNYSKVPQLPTELWAMILEKAFGPGHCLDYRSSPRKFHLFVRVHQRKYSPYHGARSPRLALSQLRLVCRRWNALLRDSSELWISAASPRRSRRSASNQRRSGSGPSSSIVGPNWVTIPDSQNIMADGELQKLKLLGINRGFGADSEVQGIIRHYVRTNADAMQRIQTIALHRFQRCQSIFRLVKQQFNGIRVIILFSEKPIEGILSLDQADTLILHANAIAIDKWRFPSLLYYSIGSEDTALMKPYDPSKVPGPISQLRCLDLSGYIGCVADANFWSIHSSLRSLSVKVPSFYFGASPPDNHPIEHIFINSVLYSLNDSSLWEGLVVQQTQVALLIVPNLKYLSITCTPIDRKFGYNGDAAQKPKQPWWLYHFRERHTRRAGEGMIWLDEIGEEIQERWHWKERFIKPWESTLATIIYGTWIASFLWGAYRREWTRGASVMSVILTPVWVLYHSWAVYDHYMA